MDFAAQAVLFDFDGVLVDSTPAVVRHWDAFAARHGLGPGNAILHTHGKRAVEKIQAFRDEHNLDLNVEEELLWFDRLEVEEADDLLVFPGARELISALGPSPWAVYTACTRPLITARLGAAGLPLPDLVISGDDVNRGKPDPEGYVLAAEGLNVNPRACVVIEDAPSGIIAGRRAGAAVIAVATTHPSDQLADANAVVRNLSEVTGSYAGSQLVLRVVTPLEGSPDGPIATWL